MAVSKRVRYEVLRRDSHACRYCGDTAPDATLVVDHVVPVALGGGDDPSNLVAACRDCNAGKTSTSPDGPLVAEVSATALTWSRAMQQAADERAAVYAHDQRIATDFRAMWEGWTYTDYKGKKQTFELPHDFDVSIRNFLAAGLTNTDFEDLIKVAMASKADKWKYFCGCSWKRIQKAQERAKEIVSSQDATERPSVALSTAYTDSQVADSYSMISKLWRDSFGTELATCVCANESGFCGDFACTVQLIGIAQGAILGPESAAGVIAIREQFERCDDGPH